LIICALCYAAFALPPQASKDHKMNYHAAGPFVVKLTPQPAEDEAPTLVRMTINKQFHGELEAVSRGEMLSASASDKRSGGYVAIEIVDGTLGGRQGTFVLQHSGTMDQGQAQLSVTVVPDSGTGELRGLSGSMKIRIESGGNHFYDFDYQIAGTP